MPVSAPWLIRSKRNDRKNTKASGAQAFTAIQSITSFSPYAPYALRSLFASQSRVSISKIISDGITNPAVVTSAGAYSAYAWVPNIAAWGTVYAAVCDALTGAETIAGDYVDLAYTSVARCALADGGSNLLLQSQDLATSWTKVNLTAPTVNNTDVAPDGTSTAETLNEGTAAAASHYLQQDVTVATAAADYALSVYLKAGTRTWAFVQMSGGGGGQSCYINLSTGALGTDSAAGAWTNRRNFVEACGNGWYRLTIVGKKPAGTTVLSCFIGMASADNTPTYTGTSSTIIAWGASLSQSSVPIRYTATTSAAVSASSQTSNRVYVKGLPASTAGLLLPGDWVQIGNWLEGVAAPLDSDAAGKGVLQLNRVPKAAIADNAAIIVHEPMGRFLLAQPNSAWLDTPGRVSEFELDLLEAVDA